MISFEQQLKILAQERISCEEVEELFCDYLDQDLISELKVRLDGHISLCPKCQAFERSYRGVIELAREIGQTPMPEGVSSRLRKALNQRLGTQL